METSLEERLTGLARRIFTRHQGQLSPAYTSQLDEAIRLCEAYQQGTGSWDGMYDAVLGEDGIWLYSEGETGDFSEPLTAMWVMETCILLCICRLGCQKTGDPVPEDLESLRTENIPSFLDFLEGLLDGSPDGAQIWAYWNENLCL